MSILCRVSADLPFCPVFEVEHKGLVTLCLKVREAGRFLPNMLYLGALTASTFSPPSTHHSPITHRPLTHHIHVKHHSNNAPCFQRVHRERCPAGRTYRRNEPWVRQHHGPCGWHHSHPGRHGGCFTSICSEDDHSFLRCQKAYSLLSGLRLQPVAVVLQRSQRRKYHSVAGDQERFAAE